MIIEVIISRNNNNNNCYKTLLTREQVELISCKNIVTK